MRLHQSEKLCTGKENINKNRKGTTTRENVFVNDISDNSLISKVYKELTWLHTRKTNNTIKKWAKDLNRHFSKEDLQRVQRDMKGRSTLLAVREMQWDIILRYHTSQNGHHKQSNKQVLVRLWRKRNPSALLVGMQTGTAIVEKQYGISSEN